MSVPRRSDIWNNLPCPLSPSSALLAKIKPSSYLPQHFFISRYIISHLRWSHLSQTSHRSETSCHVPAEYLRFVSFHTDNTLACMCKSCVTYLQCLAQADLYIPIKEVEQTSHLGFFLLLKPRIRHLMF